MYIESQLRKGTIEVICGSMFSGKTEELLRRIRRASFAKQKVALFKPQIDTRYSSSSVVSHDSNSIDAITVRQSSEIPSLMADSDVIAIDEAQFFDSELPSVCRNLANMGCRVIVAGLDMDYLGNPFGTMPSLMAIAEDVQKMHAICVRCGNLAQFSHRLSGGSDLVVLGETDHYEPLCRCCYNAALKEDGHI